jgi:hypothetical protein
MVAMVEDTIKIYMPKFLLRWAHSFRVHLNPIYADENYETDLVIDITLKKLHKIMDSWNCEIDHPNQYWYPDQVASGHIYLNNGKQFHMRVYKHPKGLMLKGHVEWHGITHPILHIMYANLDYEKGYRMLKKLLEKSEVEIIIDIGKGKYDKKGKKKKGDEHKEKNGLRILDS